MPKLQKWGVSGTEGRHFYCSKECFTSSWAVHKELHVWKERTIILDTDGHNCSNDVGVAGFGFMSDVEWNDFQATPDFTAAIPWRKSLRRRSCCRE
jgi:hypothetical protein